MEVKLTLSNSEHKDLVSFCNLNDLLVSQVVKDSFTTGFNIERYGLLNAGNEVKEKEVIKEVIKYVEVPVVEEKEVIKIEYVDVPVEKIVTKEVIVEKIVEVIKEVPVDRVVEKIVEITKEVPVEKVVIKEVIKEVPVEKIVTKIEYISDNTQTNELLLKIQQLENQMSKKDENIDELRHSLDIILAKPPVEIVKEVPVDRVVIQEKIVETIKEVPVEVIKEVIVEKEVGVVDKSKLEALQSTIQKIRSENLEKDRLIKEYEKTIQEIQEFKDGKRAVYLSGSNLNKTL
jgi:hypothetical protein